MGEGIGGGTTGLIIGILVFVVGLFGSVSRYSRVKSEAEWRYAKSRADQINSLNRLVHAAREVSRLSMIYRLYIEWAEILGFEAHRPWVADEAPSDGFQPFQADASQMPPALLVGTSEVDEETLAALGANAARSIQGEGWLLDVYQKSQTFAMARKARQDGHAVEDLNPDSDSPVTPTGAREFLLEDLRAHRPQQEAYGAAVEEIGAFCATLEPSRLYRGVSLAGQTTEDITKFLSALVPDAHRPASHFLVDLLTAQGALKRSAEEVTSYVWVPNGTVATGNVRTMPAPTTKSGQYVLSAVRIDVSPELDTSDLRLFQQQQRHAVVDRATARDDGEW